MNGSTRNASALSRLFPRRSAATREVLDVARKVAERDVNVLITGESGTGKSLLAQAIHESGPRAREPFVTLECGAIPHDLFESELFGYERGTFTGATSARRGRLETAAAGTLLLDEVAALTLPLQPKLLRVLQERRYARLGGARTLPLRARVIATTSSDLTARVREGSFREDLYFRLNVVSIAVPPLRERRKEVPFYAQRMLRAVAGGRPVTLSEEAAEHLSSYHWPGNLRELRNVLEKALALTTADVLQPEDLPLGSGSALEILEAAHEGNWTLEQLEKRYIAEVLRRCGGNGSKAADMLGIHRKTLLEKRRRYGLD